MYHTCRVYDVQLQTVDNELRNTEKSFFLSLCSYFPKNAALVAILGFMNIIKEQLLWPLTFSILDFYNDDNLAPERKPGLLLFHALYFDRDSLFFLVLLEYISCRDNSITQAILINGGSSIIKLNDQLKSITHSEAKVEMGVGKSTNIHNAMMISLEVKFMF